MRIIESANKSGTYNLVFERYLVENYQEDTFIIWTNDPGIYVGKNQNTLEEINQTFIDDNNLEVFRRLSGGGTIFHDQNTVYYSFITKNKREVKDNFIHFNNIVTDFLNTVNVEAVLSGRNDVLVNGRKVSGSAEYYYEDILVHHGSLLFNTDTAFLAQALTPNKKKFISKAVNSVKARVDNIVNYTNLNVAEFKKAFVNYVLNRFSGVKKSITPNENIETLKMIENKYGTWEWNYGKSPAYSFTNDEKYPFGIVKVDLNVSKGLIKDISITGDFFSEADVSELEKQLIGIKYDMKEIEETLKDVEVTKYIVGADLKNILELMRN
ncbi:lipoate--protein ligase [Mycoplasmatota bacterium]|nr:lipoate--protein ligase [Mycoplasmatota bacterium]